jgi:hypothetical protein
MESKYGFKPFEFILIALMRTKSRQANTQI